jgi:hypothetical protein
MRTNEAKKFDEAVSDLMTPKVPAAEVGDDGPTIEEVDLDAAVASEGDEAEVGEKQLPEWARDAIPSDLKIPDGKQVFVLRFFADWCDVPKEGDHTVVIWNLTEADEKLAVKRVTDGKRVLDEMAKQMIRAIDGRRVDWRTAGAKNNPMAFYARVGGKARQALKVFYAKRHTLNSVETTVFLAACVVAATPGS